MRRDVHVNKSSCSLKGTCTLTNIPHTCNRKLGGIIWQFSLMCVAKLLIQTASMIESGLQDTLGGLPSSTTGPTGIALIYVEWGQHYVQKCVYGSSSESISETFSCIAKLSTVSMLQSKDCSLCLTSVFAVSISWNTEVAISADRMYFQIILGCLLEALMYSVFEDHAWQRRRTLYRILRKQFKTDNTACSRWCFLSYNKNDYSSNLPSVRVPF